MNEDYKHEHDYHVTVSDILIVRCCRTCGVTDTSLMRTVKGESSPTARIRIPQRKNIAIETDHGLSMEDSFLEFVRSHRLIGYGRMMQIISHLWYTCAERDHGTGDSAHVANTCFAFLTDEEKNAFLQVLLQDKACGMNY